MATNMDQVLQGIGEKVLAASANKTALRIVGGGSKDWYGNALRGEALKAGDYRGIVSYEPTELVITARCGTPLAEIEAALAEQRQMLAFEPPHFGPGATVGGTVACALSGPRRQAVGALRDFMLGATLMNGRGEVLRFGGQVMKNVAGYDVSRLLCGSMGVLGLLLEVSIKVLPLPFAEATVRLECDQAEAIRRMNEWGGLPLPISATAWQDGALTVRLSGATAAVASARQKIGGGQVGDGEQFWANLREQRNDFFILRPSGRALWRLSVPSTSAPLDLSGAQIVEWGGAQRWLKSEEDPTDVRAAAERVGGHATLFRGGDKGIGVFHPLTATVAALHRNLKGAFDPAGIFNPGRLYEDL